MFDHIGFLVRDTKVSLPFFTACLKPLGIGRVQDRPEFDAAVFALPGSEQFLFIAGNAKGVPSYWRDGDAAGRGPMHLAFRAPSIDAVEAFHEAALAHGGADNGAPGYRASGRRPNGNYAAFVLDPDRNNVEAIWRVPL